MAANPFSGLISSTFKNQFKQAIDELVRGCELPCKLVYPPTKYTVCTNCSTNNLGRKGPNPFINGGKGRHTGTCVTCNGEGKIPVENSETINLIVIWNYSKYEYLANLVKSPEGTVQTFSKMSTIEKIKRAQYVVFNTDIQAYADHEFVRDGEPSPCGFGSDDYLVTNWKVQ